MRFPRLPAPTLPAVLTFIVVAGCALFVFSQLHPELIFMNTLTSGGDMGSHVWAPWYMKHHLLPHGRLSGWAPDWYNGFPLFTFYFPFPAVLIVALSYVIPYAVAFKLITISGTVSLPVAAWAYGRLSRLPFPVPAVLAVATLPFLFNTGFTIFGGNIASTLAGEYMFSVGLSLSFVFLGFVTGGLETNRRRAWAALFFGLIVLTHVLIAIFALCSGLLIVALRLAMGGRLPGQVDYSPEPNQRWRWAAGMVASVGLVLIIFSALIRLASHQGSASGFAALGIVCLLLGAGFFGIYHLTQRPYRARISNTPRRMALRWALSVGVVGGLISGFWSVPFVLRSHYMNDMGWEKIGVGTDSGVKLWEQAVVNYGDGLVPTEMLPVMIAALAGAAVALYTRRRVGVFWVIVAAVAALGFVYMPQGRLWNARLLPFYYLALYMLAGLLIAEIGWGLARAVRRFRDGVDYAEGLQLSAPIIAVICAGILVVPHLDPPNWWKEKLGVTAPWHDPNSGSAASFIGSWATWNYAGYNGKKSDGTYYKPAYPEYERVINMMGNVGETQGCGRVMWEYEPELDRFGTPMALMLLPLHTHGCMASEEGLFFESSATVPYHFLNQAELSKTPSSAMRDLPYGTLNVSDGVTKLQLLGVKYYLAVSPEAQAQADVDARLTRVASTPAQDSTDGRGRQWVAYEIANTDLVAPLDYLPAVMTDEKSITARRAGEGKAAAAKLSAREAWLENSLQYYQDPSRYDVPYAESGPSNWPKVPNAETIPERVPVTDPARVTNIFQSDDRISFHVENTGKPVVVRTSYFPNWKVKGGRGPYRISPNLMVVVPTSNDVELQYGRTAIDNLGTGMTVAGFIGLGFLARGDRRVDDLIDEESRTNEAIAGPPDHGDDGDDGDEVGNEVKFGRGSYRPFDETPNESR